MALSLKKVALPLLLLLVSAGFFTALTLYMVGLFSETSYKVVAVFLSLILVSNIAAKICIWAIKQHESGN